MAITIRVDLRGHFGSIRDQGCRPTCIAFVTSDAHAVARRPFEPLSVEHLYYHAVSRTPGGHPNDGVSLPAILAALEHDGQSLETGWPYLKVPPADLSLWRPPATATPVFRRRSLRQASATTEICGSLDAGQPVVVALRISARFYEPDAQGVVVSGPGDQDTDYHGVVAVGYGDEAATRYVLVRNSWGDEWGLGGHGWIPQAYLDPRLVGIAVTSGAGGIG